MSITMKKKSKNDDDCRTQAGPQQQDHHQWEPARRESTETPGKKSSQ